MRTFLVVLLVAILVGVVAAFYFDVLAFSAEQQVNGYIVSLAVHTDRITNSIPTGESKVHGRIASIAKDEKSFTLSTDDREMTFQVDAATNISGTLHGLHTGDQVVVAYRSKDGENTAREVKIDSTS